MSEPLNIKASKDELKLIYLDIVKGYTKCNIKKFGTVYIKHINLESSGYIDESKSKSLKRAKEKGLPCKEEKLEYLKKEGLWTDEKEKEMTDLMFLLDGMKQSKSKVFLQAQIDHFNKEIEKAEKKYAVLATEREELFGYTAEAYSNKKVNEFYIYVSLRKDKDLKEEFFSEEEFDNLNPEDLSDVVVSYNESSKFFNSLNLKRIALSTFFLNYFYLCDDNPQIFYGKPVVDLSYHQVELFGYARHFKHALQEMKGNPPEEYFDNPEKLEEWINAGKNADKVLEKSKQQDKEFGASSIVGATEEDLKRLGYTHDSNPEISKVSLSEKANSSKKQRLGFEDLIKIHEGKKVK